MGKGFAHQHTYLCLYLSVARVTQPAPLSREMRIFWSGFVGWKMGFMADMFGVGSAIEVL